MIAPMQVIMYNIIITPWKWTGPSLHIANETLDCKLTNVLQWDLNFLDMTSLRQLQLTKLYTIGLFQTKNMFVVPIIIFEDSELSITCVKIYYLPKYYVLEKISSHAVSFTLSI